MDTRMLKNTLNSLILSISLIFFTFNSNAIESIAKTALLIDLSTGEVLLDRNSEERTYPSSMTKIMTALMAFEKIKDGTLSMDQEFLISKKAWKMGGSKMFIEVDKKVKVSDLLLGVVVQSGNDASIAIAEGISGSEETFAIEMNNLAKKIGLTNSNFVNSSGWPNDNHYTTAKDLAKIAEYTLNEHPELYKMSGITEFTYSGIKQDNRNPLLYSFDGADGFKTGHTQAAGYGWVGKQKKVKLYPQTDISISIPKTHISDMKVEVLVEEPIPTPISINDQVGLVQIAYSDKKLQYPLIASEDIDQKGFFSRITSALYYLILGSN